jgi:hypothetical protein
MTIFQEDKPQEPRPTEVIVAREVRLINSRTLEHLKMGVKQAFEAVWSAPDPQKVIDQFGTSAVILFQASNASQQLIKALDPSWEELVPPKEFTVNEDGTVTILE